MSTNEPKYYYLQTDPPNERKKYPSRYDADVALYLWLETLRKLGASAERNPDSGRWTNTHRDGGKTEIWVEDENGTILKD